MPSVDRKEEWGQGGCPVDAIIEVGTFETETTGQLPGKEARRTPVAQTRGEEGIEA